MLFLTSFLFKISQLCINGNNDGSLVRTIGAHKQLYKAWTGKSDLLGFDVPQIEAGNSNSAKIMYYYFCAVHEL